MMTIITLLLLAVVVFSTRYFFIHPGLPLTLGKPMQRLLSYSGPAVLSAIWIPMLVVRDEQLMISVGNPYLLGGIVAIVLAYRFNNI